METSFSAIYFYFLVVLVPLIRVTRLVSLMDLICFFHHFQITFSNAQLLRKQESPSRSRTSVFTVNCSHISPINVTLNVVSVRVSLINARVLRLKSCSFKTINISTISGCLYLKFDYVFSFIGIEYNDFLNLFE